MSLTAVYDGKSAKVIKGRAHNGKPQMWTVTVQYWLQDGTKGKLTLRPNVPVNLAEITPLVAAAIAEDAPEHGRATRVTWTAMSR